MTDDKDTRPSIAELQRLSDEVLGAPPWETLDHWSENDKAIIALRNAAPALLEITKAALALKSSRKVRGVAVYALQRADEPERGFFYGQVDGADRAIREAQDLLDTALAKVRP